MNALDLAKLLETDCWYKLITREDIATMLRQQQAEIDELKKKAVKTYTGGLPNYVTETNDDKQHDAINNTKPRSSDTCGR